MVNNNVTLLAYHRIDTPTNPDNLNLSPALIDATPVAFDAQMRWLAQHYNVIPAWDLVAALRDGKRLPPRALVITFDDGYTCYKTTALPIMRKYGLPSTLFMPTSFAETPNQPFWWDTLHKVLAQTGKEELEIPGVGLIPLCNGVERDAAYKALVEAIEHTDSDQVPQLIDTIIKACDVQPACEKHIIGWHEIETLAEAGDVSIGPHTRHHPILSRTNQDRLEYEIKGSWDDLNKHIKKPLPIFAYPNGQFYAINRASREAVQNAGMVGAVTMIAGMNTIGAVDPFLMHRNGASAGQSLSRFKLSVSPLGAALRSAKRILRSSARLAHLR